MSLAAIQPGLQGRIELLVAEEHTAQYLGSGAVRVLATPQMALLMEQASVAAVDHLLPQGSCTVGAHLELRHLGPTPVGLTVRALAELLEVDGPRLSFRIRVLEEPFGKEQLVGEGIHQRVVVSTQSFTDRAVGKLAARP